MLFKFLALPLAVFVSICWDKVDSMARAYSIRWTMIYWFTLAFWPISTCSCLSFFRLPAMFRFIRSSSPWLFFTFSNIASCSLWMVLIAAWVSNIWPVYPFLTCSNYFLRSSSSSFLVTRILTLRSPYAYSIESFTNCSIFVANSESTSPSNVEKLPWGPVIYSGASGPLDWISCSFA